MAAAAVKNISGVGDGDVTPRDGGVGASDMAVSSGTRLTPSKNQTVTILVVRPQKPPRATTRPASAGAGAGADADDGVVVKEPPAPVPVPLTFKRKVDEPNGELALAELLPVIQAKLQIAVPVSGVYGADGARRASITEFVPGETCVVKSTADYAREDQRAFNLQRKLVNKLAKQDPRKRKMVIKLLPTGTGAGRNARGDALRPPPVEVMIPSSCDTLAAAHERVSEAVLKSRQALTPVLAIYAGDGTPITHLDQVCDGDVLMYRCAQHPVPAAPRDSRLAAAQRSKVASLSVPRENLAHSFEITVHRLGRLGALGGGGGDEPSSSSSSADAVAQVMMDQAVGAAGHTLRVPEKGLESMSMANLMRRIKLAGGSENITRVFLPSGAPLEHPSQLTPGVHVMYACKGDKLPGKAGAAGNYARLAAEAAEAAASAWTADVAARGRRAKPTDRIWAESALVARAGSAARGIPMSDPLTVGADASGGAGEAESAAAPKKKAAKTVKKIKRKDVRPKSAPAMRTTSAAFGSRVPFTPAEPFPAPSKKSTSKRSTVSSKAKKKIGKKSKATEEVRFIDIREEGGPSAWESHGDGGGGGGADDYYGGYGDVADGDAEALARAVGATLHVGDDDHISEEQLTEEEKVEEDDDVADEYLG